MHFEIAPRELLIARDDLRRIKVVAASERLIEDGEVLLRIEKFGITANTVTYGVIDPAFGYWNMFPASGEWGRLPVAGVARVEESRCAGIQAGERFFGFVPMATRLIVRPGTLDPMGFFDTTPQRRPKWNAYSRYDRLGQQSSTVVAVEDGRMVFGFITGYLAARLYAAQDFFGAERVVILSASAKTALTLAHSLREVAPTIRRVGVTSARNVEFVRSTGLFHDVLGYDAIDELGAAPTLLADFAGNAERVEQLYAQLGVDLVHCSLIGMTDWDARGGRQIGLAPEPVWFLSPDHLAAAMEQDGPAEFAAAFQPAWDRFTADAIRWIHFRRAANLEGASAAFLELIEGRARPDVATIVEL